MLSLSFHCLLLTCHCPSLAFQRVLANLSSHTALTRWCGREQACLRRRRRACSMEPPSECIVSTPVPSCDASIQQWPSHARGVYVRACVRIMRRECEGACVLDREPCVLKDHDCFATCALICPTAVCGFTNASCPPCTQRSLHLSVIASHFASRGDVFRVGATHAPSTVCDSTTERRPNKPIENQSSAT